MGRDEASRRLRAARLYLILEATVRGRPAAEVVEPALEGGVDVVQLRDKEASDEAVVAAGLELAGLSRARGALLVVNDRADLALECGADGVHVGQDDEDVAAVRARAGDRLLVGVSTHSVEQVRAAERSGADYFAVGPVYETPTKPGRPAVGVELVRRTAAAAPARPWFAIGGIDAERAPDVVAAGAGRLAVVRAIRDADDPREAARALRAAVAAAGSRPEAEGATVGQAV
ncbi:MAG TPA: thiamine phosphate synthase [Thermoleophilaceae bacterium]|jgi:thiamine-phosphate pyrophosphorylase